MKKTSLIALLMAGVMLAGCNTVVDQTTEAATTAAPSVTTKEPVPHVHMDAKFPAEFDFSDTASIEKYFDMCEILDGVRVKVQAKAKQIYLSNEVLGEKFTLVVDLSGAAGKTSPEQIVTCAKLFWYCYPRMYLRFGKTNPNTPTTVTLAFEDFGYEIASAGGDRVHIYDQWLADHKQDFDCLTHEFSHIIQGGWNGAYVPSRKNSDGSKDTYMIERFADYCRYLYSYQNGRLNDLGWELQTINGENSYGTSVRFWVWLDYTYSTPSADIMQRIAYYVALKDRNFTSAKWEPEGEAWASVFGGTAAEGKTIHELWDEYAATDMCKLSSKVNRAGSVSPLLKNTPLRSALRERYASLDSYLNCK